MKKRWIALLLALTMAGSMLAGCTQKADTPVEPEQGQTEQEPKPSDENQTEPVTPQEPEKEDEPKPEEDKPDEPQPEEEPEIELTPEQKRRREIEAHVAETEISVQDKDFANPFTEEAARSQLTQYLYDNWDNEALPVSTYFEDDGFRLNIYQNSLEEYTCVLSRTDSFDERYIRLTARRPLPRAQRLAIRPQFLWRSLTLWAARNLTSATTAITLTTRWTPSKIRSSGPMPRRR